MRIFDPGGASVELAEAIRRAQGERGPAIEALLRELRPELLSFFARRLRDESAEDLTQLALVRIVGAIERIEPERAGRYIATIAKNLLRTAVRQRARHAMRIASDTDADELCGVDYHDAVERHTDWQRFVEAVVGVGLLAMTPAVRDVFLSAMRGRTTEEIAAEHGINPITVRTRLMRARQVLKRELDARHQPARWRGVG